MQDDVSKSEEQDELTALPSLPSVLMPISHAADKSSQDHRAAQGVINCLHDVCLQ